MRILGTPLGHPDHVRAQLQPLSATHVDCEGPHVARIAVCWDGAAGDPRLHYMCVKLLVRFFVCHRVGPFWVHFGSILGPILGGSHFWGVHFFWGGPIFWGVPFFGGSHFLGGPIFWGVPFFGGPIFWGVPFFGGSHFLGGPIFWGVPFFGGVPFFFLGSGSHFFFWGGGPIFGGFHFFLGSHFFWGPNFFFGSYFFFSVSAILAQTISLTRHVAHARC